MDRTVNADSTRCSKKHHSSLGTVPSGGIEVVGSIHRNRGVVRNALQHHSLSSLGGSQVGVVASSVTVILSLGSSKGNHIRRDRLNPQGLPVSGIAEGGVGPLKVDQQNLIPNVQTTRRRGSREGSRGGG